MRFKLQRGFIDPLTIGLLGFFIISIILGTTAIVRNTFNTRSNAAGGSCQGDPPPGCKVSGFAIGGCGGRSESNCGAVSSCGCHWVSDNSNPPVQPPTNPNPPSNPNPGGNCNGS